MCVCVWAQHSHRNQERETAGIVSWVRPFLKVTVIPPVAGVSVFLFAFSWWWKRATAVFRAASLKEVLYSGIMKSLNEWIVRVFVSSVSLFTCLTCLANPAIVIPPRIAAGFLDYPVFFCWIQRFSHGQSPSPHFHGLQLNDSLALCLVSESVGNGSSTEIGLKGKDSFC